MPLEFNPFIKTTTEEDFICQQIVKDVNSHPARDWDGLRAKIHAALNGKQCTISLAYRIKSGISSDADYSSEWIERLVLNHLFPGFIEKKLEEKILLAKQQNQQAALAFEMLQSFTHRNFTELHQFFQKYSELGLTPSETIGICTEVLRRGKIEESDIFYELKQLGISEWPFEERLRFAKELVMGVGINAKTLSRIYSVIYHLKEFGLNDLTGNQRLLFFRQIIEMDSLVDAEEGKKNTTKKDWYPRSEATGQLIKMFDQLGLADAPQDVLLAFLLEIANRGLSNSVDLLSNFKKLTLTKENQFILL